jgi:hypothetical protein
VTKKKMFNEIDAWHAVQVVDTASVVDLEPGPEHWLKSWTIADENGATDRQTKDNGLTNGQTN